MKRYLINFFVVFLLFRWNTLIRTGTHSLRLDTVQKIVDAFRQSEGEVIPAEIIDEDLNNRKLTTLTVKGVNKIPPTSSRATPSSDDGLFAFANIHSQPPESVTDVKSHDVPNKIESGNSVESAFDREEIVRTINLMALTTYKITGTRIHDYLKSLFQLANFLMRSGLSTSTFNATSPILSVIILNISNIWVTMIFFTVKPENLNLTRRFLTLSANLFFKHLTKIYLLLPILTLNANLIEPNLN